MKRLRILGLSLAAMFALGAIASNVALSEEGILPATSFKIKGGLQKRENLNKEKVECTSVEGTAVPLPESDTHFTGTLDFNGCKAFGFEATSLGDKAGLVLAEVLYLVCLFGEGTKLDWGVLVATKELPFHIEVPALKELVLVKGAIIGELLTKLAGILLGNEPEGKEFGVDFLAEDTTTRLKCSLTGLGPWTASYEEGLDTKPDVDAWRIGELDITFEKAVKFMDK